MNEPAEGPLLRPDLRIDGCEVRRGRKYLRLRDLVLREPDHRGFVLSLDALPRLLPAERLVCDVPDLPDEPARDSDAWRQFVARLDAGLLLANDRAAAATAARAADWATKPLRPAAHAGAAYPAEAGALRRAVAACFLRGPGRLPGPADPHRRCLGVFAPHADLDTSGACAAHAFLALAESAPTDVYVLIGPNHAYGALQGEVLLQDLETPLGRIGVRRDLAETLVAASDGAIRADGLAHYPEHSLELHLPFLQWIHERQGRPLSVVPLLIGMAARMRLFRAVPGGPLGYSLAPAAGYEAYLAKLVRAVRVVCRAARVTLVVSGDLLHYGQVYDTRWPHIPRADLPAAIRWLDDTVLLPVQRGAPGEALAQSLRTNHCGNYALYVAQQALGGPPGRLLHYDLALQDDPADAVGVTGVSVASLLFG